MKLVIDLPDEVVKWFKGKGFIPIGQYLTVDEAMKKAEPLSEVLAEIKREIKEKCDRIDDIARANIYQYAPHREIQDLLCEILESIGKAESQKLTDAVGLLNQSLEDVIDCS